MKVVQRSYRDFTELEERPFNSRGNKVSLILPARHEQKTIGSYFPVFSNLMMLGCIDEIVIADSSDDHRTIDDALDSAMSTHPFSDAITQAMIRGGEMPVKAVNVYDEMFQNLFNGYSLERGKPSGKGSAMYLGMAVATGNILVFLDSDFQNISGRFVYGLVGPFEDPKTILSKATFELEDNFQGVIDNCNKSGENVETCDLLLKSVNARTLAGPLMTMLDYELELFPGISQFQGPLSGGVGAHRDVWTSLMIPVHYGVEVSYLMQLVDNFPNGHYAYDVNLGEVLQESQDAEGRIRMGRNIMSTILHHIKDKAPELYNRWVEDPSLCIGAYLKQAADFVVHSTNAERISLYSSIMQDILTEGYTTPILPPLNQNLHYTRNREQIAHFANQTTAESIRRLSSNIINGNNYQPQRREDAIVPVTPAFI